MIVNIQNESEGTWITPRRFALLLGALIFVSWPGIFLGRQSFVFRDFGYFSLPLAWHLKESFWRMEWPLWNPLNNCGQPFLAEWNTQALYPPALLYVLLPLPWSLNVFCVLHLFLGGLGMFFLVRHWTQNSFGAALAGVVFTFSGLALSSLLWPATISGLGWMPWVIWLTKRAWHEGGRMIAIAAIAGALQMLSGGVEVVLVTWALLGAMSLIDFVSGDPPRTKVFLRLVIIVAFISGLSAAQLLPFFDFLKHSERQGNYFATDSPMPTTGWVNFLVPLFHCEEAQGIFFQKGQYWILSYYSGIITVALAGLAIWRRPRAQVLLLGILAIFFIVLAMGNATPLYHWLCSHVSFIGLMRFPIKFVLLPIFALPVMAAYALAEKKPQAQDAVSSSCSWLFLWLITLALISGCLVWEFRLQPLHDTSHAVLINGLVHVILFTAVIIGLFVIEKTTQDNLCRWLQVLVLLLVWLDLNRTPQPSTVNPAVFQPNMSRPAPPARFGLSRALIPADALNTLTFAAQPDAARDFLTHRFGMFSDCNLLDDIPKCDGFFPINLREHVLLNENLNTPMQDFLGASEMLVVHNNVLVWATRSTFMPLLTGGQKPIFAGDATTLLRLGDTNFNPRTEVYLPLEARDPIAAANIATVKISPDKFSAHEIDAHAEASAPAMLVVAQSYYHNWRAYVDGEPTPLWRANYAFQALEIPTGAHQVKLIYVDWHFRLGLIISFATLACALVLYCLSAPRTKA